MTELPSRTKFPDQQADVPEQGLHDEESDLLDESDEDNFFMASLQDEADTAVRENKQDALGQIMERVSRDLDPLCGQQLGEYLIQERISWTPSSRVFLARRIQGYSQPVVVKVISDLAGGDEQYLRRFERERQFLAGLKSPAIATILDGGTTPEGFPYLVMEYVEGEHLDSYCDHHRLNIAERLKLFQSVCDAVTYCHQHGVIHRDLKPNNILVTKTGQVKLVDFGLARLVEERPEFAGLSITVTRKIGFTPEYTSPEQVSGKSVSTRSDVYSLGVILYELLTGQRPYKVDVRNLVETSQIINLFVPQTPSRVVWKKPARGEDAETLLTTCRQAAECRNTTPERLAHQLRGDLDNLVKMALRKEPDRRYQSVVELSADITRYFEHEPLLAQRDSRAYVLKKFLRRHVVGLSLFVVFCGLLIGGVTGISIVWLRALRAEKLYQEKADQVTQTNQEMQAAQAKLTLTEAQYLKLLGEKKERTLKEAWRNILPPVERGADGAGDQQSNAGRYMEGRVPDEVLRELMIRSILAIEARDLSQAQVQLELMLFHYLGEEQKQMTHRTFHPLEHASIPHKHPMSLPNPVLEIFRPLPIRGDSQAVEGSQEN